MANTKAKEVKKESPAVETKTEEKQKLIPYIIPLDPGMVMMISVEKISEVFRGLT